MERLRITTSVEMVRIPTDDIIFVQADGNYSDVHLYNGKSIKMTFKLHFFDEVLHQQSTGRFVRVGKSLIVNKDYIYRLNTQEQFMVLGGGRMSIQYQLHASKEALKELWNLLDNE